MNTLLLLDEELVVRCKTELPGNTRSYEMLVQRHMNRVYTIVYRVLGNKEEAEDITQEVFVKVFNSLKKFEQKSSFSTWLYRIATNSALDALDKIQRQRKTHIAFSTRTKKQDEEHKDQFDLPAPSETAPEERAMQKELRECINRVLKQLGRDHARLLILRDFNDLSYDEIAKSLEAGLSAVKMRIHRARLAFQEMFGQFCGSIYLSFSTSTTVTRDKARPKKE